MNVTVIGGAGGERTAAPTPRIFDGPGLPADPRALTELAARTMDADLAAPPVVLPDFHHKTNMELPSSVAVATTDTIRPTLTSASVNCGMALIALDADRPDERGTVEFYRRVRERYPYPASNLRELSAREVRRTTAEGAIFAAERYGVDDGELDRVEEGGHIDLDRYGGAQRLARELPWLAFQLARLRFGTVGPSNHFVELQVVEEVFDHDAAAALGVREGQLTLQYHAGGGVLTGEIGALFGRRRHNPRHIRLAMAVEKPLFHLATARSVAQFRQRWAMYFAAACPPVPRHSDEGQRLMLANAAAMNYGFAFRIATYAALKRIAADVFGGGGRLVVDSPHNSIYEEPLPTEAGTAVVHRHNSCRAYPAGMCTPGTTFASTGQAVLLPGTSRTSSYLAVAGPRAADSLYSACHGAGTLVEGFVADGRSRPHPAGPSTLRFRYSDAAPERTAHFDDNGVNAALGVLAGNGLVRPVARMRPFAVLT
ncbi:MAG TPA: RtcB family protein [Micromonosporaceae bacterium]|nr:RtcB family protein [Micromonosporaceae bacterium]